MKINSIGIIIFALLLIFACNSEKNTSFDKFPKIYSLSGNEGGDVFSRLSGLSVYDSILIINKFNLPPGEKMLSFHSINGSRFFKKALSVGRGPAELNFPGWVRVFGDYLYVHDPIKKELYEYNLPELIYAGNENYNKRYKLSKQQMVLEYLPGNEFLISYANRENSEYLLSFLDYDGAYRPEINMPNNIHAYPKPVDKETMSTMGLYSYTKHPDKPLYAFAFRFADVFAITDEKGKVIAKISGPDHIEQTPTFNQKSWYEAYSDIKSDKKYVYCVFKGFEFTPVGINETPEMANQIHVFTWDGKPVASISLDHHIGSFEVIPEHSLIVVVSTDNGKLIKYELPDFK